MNVLRRMIFVLTNYNTSTAAENVVAHCERTTQWKRQTEEDLQLGNTSESLCNNISFHTIFQYVQSIAVVSEHCILRGFSRTASMTLVHGSTHRKFSPHVHGYAIRNAICNAIRNVQTQLQLTVHDCIF